MHCAKQDFQHLCSECGKRYSRPNELVKHLERTHGIKKPSNESDEKKKMEAEEQHQCDQCEKMFSSIGRLNNHISHLHTVCYMLLKARRGQG
jgi:uncharacterized C2H2 Zn-finger protein